MFDHWLETAMGRIRAGDSEAAVMADYGWVLLTDAEREAIKDAIDCCEDITYGEEASPEAAATLRGLLERLG